MKTAPLLTSLAVLSALACSREKVGEPAEAKLTFTLSPTTKSVLPASLEGSLRTLTLLFVQEDDPSRWRSSFLDEEALRGPGIVTSLPGRNDFTVYAFVNMGNVLSDIPRLPSGALDIQAYRYYIADYASLREGGFPMAGELRLSSAQIRDGSCYTLCVQPLVSKLTVVVDHTGITGGVSGVGISNSSISIRNVCRVLCPFAAPEDRRAKDPATDIFPGETEYEAFSSGSAMDKQSETLVFYVPENRQGKIAGILDQEQKAPEKMDAALISLCTYVEFRARKIGNDDGVSGELTYRFYPGNNTSWDFSLEGGKTYPIRLSLTWDGLFLKGSWRVDNDGLVDMRTLSLSQDPTDADTGLSRLDRIGRTRSTDLYVHFSRDGGSAWTAGAKDLKDWPYGWDLFIDGQKQAAGKSAVARGDIRWRYGMAGDRDLLTIIPGQGATFGSTHSVQVKSADGRICSNVVEFEVGLPLEGRWAQDESPSYVAQKGLLACYDPELEAITTEGVFHSSDPSKIRIEDNRDGTAWICLLGPFPEGEAGIFLTDRKGDRRCDIPLGALLPHFACTPLSTTYVDASAPMRFTYYRTRTDGSRDTAALGVSEKQGCGDYLDRALCEELIAPECHSSLGLLGFSRKLDRDGSFRLDTYLATYRGLSPSGNSFYVDEALVGMNGYAERGLFRTYFTAWNPWRDIGTPLSGQALDDHTLYCEPARFPAVGWNPAADRPRAESYSLSVPNAIVADASALSLCARLEGGEILGDIFSGTPGRTEAGQETTYWEMTYSLNGIKREDISMHGIGKLFLDQRLINNHDGSMLENTVATAGINLHLYVWPVAFGPGKDSAGPTFDASLYASTDRLTQSLAPLFDGDISLTAPVGELYDDILLVRNEAKAGVIHTAIPEDGTATWRFPEKERIDSKTRLRERLRQTTYPFEFLPQSKLDALPIHGKFIRLDAFTLRYYNGDENGSALTIYLGKGDRGDQRLGEQFYFTPDYAR